LEEALNSAKNLVLPLAVLPWVGSYARMALAAIASLMAGRAYIEKHPRVARRGALAIVYLLLRVLAGVEVQLRGYLQRDDPRLTPGAAGATGAAVAGAAAGAASGMPGQTEVVATRPKEGKQLAKATLAGGALGGALTLGTAAALDTIGLVTLGTIATGGTAALGVAAGLAAGGSYVYLKRRRRNKRKKRALSEPPPQNRYPQQNQGFGATTTTTTTPMTPL